MYLFPVTDTIEGKWVLYLKPWDTETMGKGKMECDWISTICIQYSLTVIYLSLINACSWIKG
jgi:hypothetical protein